MKKNKNQLQLTTNMKVLKILIAFLLIAAIAFFFKQDKSLKNWQFYTKESIGANNNLSIYNNLVFDNNALFFNSQDKKTYSLDTNSGQINWVFKAQNYSPYPPTIYNHQVFLASFDGNIYSLEKDTGYKIWQFSTEEQFQPDTPVVHSLQNELVFFGSRNGTLYTLDSNNGQLLWKKEFQKLDTSKEFVSNTLHFGSVYADEQQIYVLNALDKKFYALDQKSGEVNWQIDNLTFSFISPLFLEQSIIFKQEQYLLSIDKKSGTFKKFVRQNPDEENWEFYEIKNNPNHLLILDHHTLTKISSDLLDTEWQINSIGSLLNWQDKAKNKQVEITNNLILSHKYLGLENGDHLVAIDYEEGKAIWDTPISSSVNCQYYAAENAFLGMGNGDVYSIDIKLGKINWQNRSASSIAKILPIKNNILTIAHSPGEKVVLKSFDQSGKEIWQYSPEEKHAKNEIYINQDNVYVILNSLKKIIEKINIDEISPNKKTSKKLNFFYKEIKDRQTPFLELQEKESLNWKIKEQYLKVKYLTKHFRNIFSFEKNEQIANSILEISIINDENLYRNKFTDLNIEAIFNQVNQTDKTVIKGFYYDNNVWKIRFMAPEKGDYEYQIKIKSPYFVKKMKGVVTLEKGKLEKISIKQNQLTINDDKAFFPIGIQVAFFDRNYNGSLNEEIPNSSALEPVKNTEQYSYINLGSYLNMYQKEAGVNIFRYGVENFTPSLWQSIEPNRVSFDIGGGKFGDNLLQKLSEKNFKVIMTIFGFHPPYITKEQITKKENQKALANYLDYVIARFSSYVDLWEIANEAVADDTWYKFVTDYLRNNDPYHHPISTSWETDAATDLDFLSVHWYNLDQIDPGSLSNNIAYLSKKYLNPDKPVLISEFGFKNYSYFKNSADSMRILSWLSVFQNMGIVFWSQGQNGIYQNPDNANIYLGPIERSYLLSLNNFLTQNLSLPLEKEMMIIPGLESQVHFLKNDEVILAYILKTNTERSGKEYINIYFKKKAKFQWIEPKTNAVLKEIIFEKGRKDILIPAFKVDLAIKITYLD